MGIAIAPLFSSSSGNCVYISDGKNQILIDAGVTGSKAEEALHFIGKTPADLSGILVTHEHIDHVKGVGVLSRKYNLPVFANADTWNAMQKKIGDISLRNTRIIDDGEFYIDSLCIRPVHTYHDAADPLAYAIYSGGKKVGVMTDTGHVTRAMVDAMEQASIIMLEANHDVEMLKNGNYSATLKKRILSGNGHLSNDSAGDVSAELVKRGVRGILLSHLSRDNNRKDLAMETVRDLLHEKGIEAGKDVSLGMTRKDHVTGYYRIGEVD